MTTTYDYIEQLEHANTKLQNELTFLKSEFAALIDEARKMRSSLIWHRQNMYLTDTETEEKVVDYDYPITAGFTHTFRYVRKST